VASSSTKMIAGAYSCVAFASFINNSCAFDL
jgi:hypothetical protein